MTRALLSLLPLLAAVALHEAGHLTAARLLGIPVRSCAASPLGGQLTFDFSRAGYGREALVHAAGPGLGLVAALLLRGTRFSDFAGLSLVLAAVNLLPLPGFDGAGILRCALLSFLPPERADSLSRGVSVCAEVLLWLFAARLALREGRIGILLFAMGAAGRGAHDLSQRRGRTRRE